MSPLRPRVLVAGAGAAGSMLAFVLARAGFKVTVVDPAALGANASGVAAGMLAAGFEAVLDPIARSHFDLFAEARRRWTVHADALGPDHLGLHKSGALWATTRGDRPGLIDAHQRAFAELGVACDRIAPDELRRRAPGLAADAGEGLFIRHDWRLSPAASLARLRAAATDLGASFVRKALLAFEGGVAALADGQTLATDWLVVATGAAAATFAPEQDGLTPIKGHILRFPGVVGADDQPAVRWSGGYAVPGAAGLTIGATMEPGLADVEIDPVVVEQLHDASAALFPGLAGAVVSAQAGVRAATADGLPLVGPSRRPRTLLATGLRRNGWLLAPLAAEIVLAQLSGADPGPWAAKLDPRRNITRA